MRNSQGINATISLAAILLAGCVKNEDRNENTNNYPASVYVDNNDIVFKKYEAEKYFYYHDVHFDGVLDSVDVYNTKTGKTVTITPQMNEFCALDEKYKELRKTAHPNPFQ